MPDPCIHHPDTQYTDDRGRRICGGCEAVWNPQALSWENQDGSADYLGQPEGPIHVTSEKQGVKCMCMFHPDSAVSDQQKLALSVFGIATYATRMDHGDDLSIEAYCEDVLHRFRSTIDVITRGGHNHDPVHDCYPGCPVFHQENPT